jgi:DNA-binding NarL/FixJ family response regulator
MSTESHFHTPPGAEVYPMDTASKIRVLIVDEHPSVRKALAARLMAFPNIAVLATAPTLEWGLESLRARQPDVVLLDLRNKGDHGSNPVRRIVDMLASRPVGIIVLTSFADDREREMILQAGAQRYLLKNIDSARLVEEIEAVATEIGRRAQSDPAE